MRQKRFIPCSFVESVNLNLAPTHKIKKNASHKGRLRETRRLDFVKEIGKSEFPRRFERNEFSVFQEHAVQKYQRDGVNTIFNKNKIKNFFCDRFVIQFEMILRYYCLILLELFSFAYGYSGRKIRIGKTIRSVSFHFGVF